MILATGSGYRKLDLPNEDTLSGKGVSWCATCDGFFFREQHIAVVGGGDSAVEEATFLTRFGSKVTLIHRRDELRASKIMQERAFADPKLEMAWNSEVASINGEDRLESITLRDTVTGEERELAGDRPVHRGRPRPPLGAAQGQVDLDDDGYVLVDHPSTRTNIPGVFAAGDLVDHHYRQAITAAGTGCAAALDAERYIADPGPRGLHRRSGRRHRRRGGRVGRDQPGRADRRSLIGASPRTAESLSVRWCSIDIALQPEGTTVGNIAAVTDAEFDTEVLKSDKPVLVDFWAEWCGPCRQVAPILDEIASQHGDKIEFRKMNVDENPVTPASYRVTGIPTINVYQNGEVVRSIVGAKPKAALLNELSEFIA